MKPCCFEMFLSTLWHSFKVSHRRRLSGKVPNGGKASPRLEIRRKATVAATKPRREKGSGGGSGSGFSGLGEDGSGSHNLRSGGDGGVSEDSAGEVEPRRLLQGKGKVAAAAAGEGGGGSTQRHYVAAAVAPSSIT
jgi:hypothetical protein